MSLIEKDLLIITAVFPPEPVVSATLTYDIASKLSESNSVVVLSPKPTRPLGFTFVKRPQESRKFRHYVLGSYTCPKSRIIGRMLESFSLGIHATKYIRKNFNSIKAIYLMPFPLIAPYIIVKWANRFNIPIVVHKQDIYPESLANKIPLFGSLITKALLPIDRYAAENATRIIANSEKMQDHIVRTRNVSSGKIEIVRNWLDESDFISFRKKKALRDNGAFRFMYLGNIGPVAGVELLIEAFVEARLLNSILVIAGSGSNKKDCILLVKRLNAKNIEFIDVPEGKVAEIQDGADAMLLPVIAGAASSSMPSKLIAYMLSSRPVIACVDRVSDTADTILSSGCGWVIPPEDVIGLSETMISVSSISRQALLRKGEEGFQFAISNFSKTTNQDRLSNLVQELAASERNDEKTIIQ